MSLLLTVSDARDGYDDDAALARSLARAAGWDAASVLLVAPGGPRTAGTDATGARWVRVPAPTRVADPLRTQLKAIDDRLFGVRAALAADPGRAARLKLAAEERALRTLRERVEANGVDAAESIAAADRLDALVGALAREVKALAPTLVVACGSEAFLAAVRVGARTVHVEHVADVSTDTEYGLVVRERLAELGSRSLFDMPTGRTVASWGHVLREAGVEGAPDSLPPVPAPQQAEPVGEGFADVRLGVGPAGFAGQAWAWASAARTSLGVTAEVVTVEQDVLNFPADVRPSPAEWASLDWQVTQLPRALAWTHALSESVRPLLGLLNGSVLTGDLPALRRAAVSVGVVCHGSEIRDPRLHGRLYEHAPFGDEFDDVPRLQEVADRNARILNGFAGPVFVSTPDLLDSLPHAVWLPVTVLEPDFAPGSAVLERDVPVVLHAPSSPRWKGTSAIEPVLARLVAEGLVDYRRLDAVPPAQLPALLREADVVIDHVVVGNYGVLACQALAAGRVVVGHVSDRVRRRVPLPVPIVEATPPTLEAVLRSLLADRAAARAAAAEGPGFVRALHDGRLAASVLRPWLSGAVRW
ncbi:hypothetical protein [Motilibacter deserti]|uniref:Glycosyltransferase involved in cell wall biosynthesis n=1 Tax=Motilibacter deserti TaxID=2714956 RepID=A0ABX0GY01_9ACTN|nr:hypothetical protein [Motilibacter deserti]NHC15475.1 hypothetical protein [Motilibacter deserti]